MSWPLRVKTQAPVIWSGRWWRLRRFPLEGVVLESRRVAVWWCSSFVLACERRGGTSEWWWCAEAGLGIRGG
jgi:hypothetical protein